MWKKFQNMAKVMLAFLGVAEIPIENGAISFSDEQKQKLAEALGGPEKLTEIVTAMNQELADIAAAQATEEDQELKDLREEARKMLKAHGLSQEDADALVENPTATNDASEKQLLAGLIKSQKDMDAKLEKLINEPEGDAPTAQGVLKNLKDMHSKTHFLGSRNTWDAFEGRNWNQRAAGLTKSPTDWSAESKVEIQKLKDDVDLYYRENPTEINSLHRDLLGLPDFWNIRTNVDDKVADGNIVSGEISQSRKLPWVPKNKQLIQPEESKIFPVHIDIEHQGYYLQQIETSWLNSWNKEGSSPYKMSFVRFLLSELDKKARQEDRKVAINGVYVKTPEDATVAGSAIARGDGLLIQLWRAYFIDSKFRVANIGAPTTANIVDYIVDFLETNLPEESKNTDGLVLYLSPTWLRRYKSRYRQLYGLENDFSKDGVMQIENYPNVRFQTLRDMEGSDFMFLTFDDNIELMENVPGEKSMYNFDSLKRNVYIYADYKWGSRFKHIGTKVSPTDPDSFKVQTVWANMPPYLHDTFVSLYDDTTGIITLPYSNIETKSGWATNITELKGYYEGQIVRIRGAASGVTGSVVDNAKFDLAGDANFDLSTGGTLTLLSNGDGTFKEIKRTTAPPAEAPTDVTFTGDTVDADEGNVFKWAGASNDNLAGILNGVENTQTITIYGSAGVETLTINDITDNVEVASAAVLTLAADYIKFVKIDGVWTEIERSIA